MDLPAWTLYVSYARKLQPCCGFAEALLPGGAVALSVPSGPASPSVLMSTCSVPRPLGLPPPRVWSPVGAVGLGGGGAALEPHASLEPLLKAPVTAFCS